MNKNWLLLVLISVFMFGCSWPNVKNTDKPKNDTQKEVQKDTMVNPATKYCMDMGGQSKIETRGDGGQYGVCIFEDNRQCEEWLYMSGRCQEGGYKVTGFVTDAARYCAITGGTYEVKPEKRADGSEDGDCTLITGSKCNVWDYYNGSCMSINVK